MKWRNARDSPARLTFNYFCRSNLLFCFGKVEAEAANCFGDHIFLDLDQIAVRIGHAEDGENVAATADHYKRTGPVVLIGFAAIVKFTAGDPPTTVLRCEKR